MKRRDKRKRRKKRDELKASSSTPAGTVRVTRDSHGKMYINAPDGSQRRADKIDPEKLDWLSGA